MTISAAHLCKSYHGAAILRDLSFTADSGLVRITGRSGAGKTTLLRILLGLEAPDSGTLSGTSCRWAAVFQEDRLLAHLSASGNLRFILGPAYDSSRTEALLFELGLGEAGDRKVCEYSGGMKRRLSLARALLAPADALALDEPFTGLDAENRAAALRCILRAAEEKPVFLAAHESLDLPCGSAVIAL